MTQCIDPKFQPLVEAYADNELPASARDAVAAHLSLCAACAVELARLRKLSAAFASYRPDLSAESLARIHAAFSRTRDAVILRIARSVSAAAAIILLTGTLYLTFLQTAGGAQSTSPVWEQAAVAQYSDAQPASASVPSTGAEQQLAEFMASDLSASNPQ